MIISVGAAAGFYFQSRDQAQAMAISRLPVFEVSSPMQMTIPMGSAKPDKPEKHVTFQTGISSAQPDPRPSILTIGVTEGQFAWPPPPELLKKYDSEMKKVRGESVGDEGAKITESSKRSFGEPSQPTLSSTTISEA